MRGFLGSEQASVADNQGNTYILATDSGNRNEQRAQIWYAHNIGSPSGTFTVTATALGGGSQQTIVGATEYSGFGATDPLTGAAVNGSGNSSAVSVGPTGSVGAAEVLVCATVAANAVPGSITVETVSPAWTNQFNVVGSALVGSAVSRVVTDMGAQSCAWTLSTASPWGACIVAFAALPLDADAQLTHQGRQVLWIEPGAAQLIQMARQVLYPATCVPGPINSILLKLDTDFDTAGGGGGGGGPETPVPGGGYTGTGGDDDGEEYLAFVKTRAYPPGGSIKKLGTIGQIQQPLVVTRKALTTLQLEIDKDRGRELETDTVNLAAQGTETRVIRKFEGAGVADASLVQFKLGDILATVRRWTIDRFQARRSGDGDK
jgi:hypothetical protein